MPHPARNRYFARQQAQTTRRQSRNIQEHVDALEVENHIQGMELSRVNNLLTSFLSLCSEHLEEIRRLQEELDRLSLLPDELNVWYGRYAEARETCSVLQENIDFLH